MDFSIFYRFGLNPNDFDISYCNTAACETGLIHKVRLRVPKERFCPFCKGTDVVIHCWRKRKLKGTINEHLKEILELETPRFLCRSGFKRKNRRNIV